MSCADIGVRTGRFDVLDTEAINRDFYFQPDSDLSLLNESLMFVVEDTLPPLKERRRQQAQMASRPSQT